jgi:hypothetical protein
MQTCNHAAMHFFIFILFLLLSTNIIAQEINQFEFLPSGLNFQPLKANIQEARMGILFYPDNNNLKVDIGNSIDLLKLSRPGNNMSIASGIEFMAYALSTSYKGHRLQIDALDGFFGGNLTFKKMYSSNELDLRLRIIHNSAHFVDGHFDFNENKWIDSTKPIHYTRNFYEITAANQLKTGFGYFKYYGAFSHAFFVRPPVIKRINFYAGYELAFSNLFGKVFDKDENIFITSYLYLAGFNVYVGSQQTMLGIKFGEWNNKGITFYSSYYSGLDFFDAYYGKRISKFGLGFNIDFP